MGDGPAGADRSTRQQAQDAFFAVVESAPFGMHFYDLLPDGRLVFSGANPAADRILGVANAQFLGKTIEEAFPPLVDTEVPARYREAAAEGRPWRTEQLSYRDNVIVGAFEVTAFQIGPRRMATVFQDITERKLAEVALTREKERLAVTLGSIADGVLSTDAEGRITLLNRMAVHLTGWSTDAAAGRQVEDVLALFGACGQESVDNPVRAALARGEVTALPPNTVARTTGGREFAVEGAAAPIRDEAGQVVGAVLAVRDTTERQRLEEIERRSQRLESLGLLAGGIAHDFNNMLSGLFGYIDLARAASEEPASVRRYMTNAASVLDRARGLAYQLLTFARGSAPVRRAVHLDELLHQTVPFALTGSAIEARFDMAPDLPAVHADAAQFSQAIDNLLINARQAMPGGGVIEVGASRVAPGTPLPEGLQAGNPYVMVTIRDSGVGIAPENLSRIFDPYFTTKQGGSGLGLASVHSIITQHDGAVTVVSEVGHGTTMRLYLPASKDVSAAAGRPAAPAGFAGRTVLVMDDEPSIRDVLGAMLRRLGCNVVTVSDGSDALIEARALRDRGERFDAVILDLTVPGGLGGIEALQALLAVDPGLRAIASSGYSEDPVMASPADFGFKASMRKPYVMDDLRLTLAAVLDAD